MQFTIWPEGDLGKGVSQAIPGSRIWIVDHRCSVIFTAIEQPKRSLGKGELAIVRAELKKHGVNFVNLQGKAWELQLPAKVVADKGFFVDSLNYKHLLEFVRAAVQTAMTALDRK